MSKCFLSDSELELYDRGFTSGVYAAVEEFVRQYPDEADKFEAIKDKVLSYVTRGWTDKEKEF